MRNVVNSTLPQYRLEQWMTLRMQLLWAYERRMNHRPKPDVGDYGFQSALFVREGWVDAGSSAKLAQRANVGEWMILGQGKRWQRFSDECRLLSIGFRFQLPTGDPVYHDGLPLVVKSQRFPKLLDCAQEVLQEMDQRIGLGYLPQGRVVGLCDYLSVQNVFRDFLMELAEALSKSNCPAHRLNDKNRHVSKAFSEMDKTPAGQPWTAKQLAVRVGISLPQLDRLMVADTGITVYEQMERRRLAAAEDALQSRAVSLKTIAYQLGFSSASHFSSWFKKRRGVSPGKFSPD